MVEDLTGNPRYPHSPDEAMMLPRLEAPTDIADNFGGRIVGYLYPETSGDYTFWIASDDASALYLSTSESLCDAVKICGHNAWTPSRQFDWYPEQKSAPQSLTGGQKYLIMALYKEGGGGDNMAVAWEGPDCPSRDVIDGAYLTAGYTDAWAAGPSPADGATVTKEEGSMLSWVAGAGAVEHDVYHGTDPMALAYVGTKPAGDESINVYGVVDGQTYYWQVNEVIDANTVVEGCIWSYTTAEWVNVDIGDAWGGTATKAGDCWTIEASGSDIWGGSDHFHFVYQTPTFTRDQGEIIARNMSIVNTNGWAKFGVMMRETLAPGSKNTCMLTTPNTGQNRATFQSRPNTNGGSGSNHHNGVFNPEWVKLVRNGSEFKGYHSDDGENWHQHGTRWVDMSSFVRVGLAVTSHNSGALTTAEICDVSITTPDPHNAWGPDPADGASGVPYDKVLGWNPGDGIKSHEVYFGTDPDALELVAEPNLGNESYDPGGMDMGKTYYWQIVEVNNPTWAGSVWSFTVQTYRVIEDFESYDVIPVPPPPQEIIGGDYIEVYAEAPADQEWVPEEILVDSVAPNSACLIAEWAFEGNYDDTSGSGFHGAPVGSDVNIVNDAERGLVLSLPDADSNYVDCGNPAALNFATGNWSLSAWVKNTMTGTGDTNKGAIIANGGDGGGGIRYCLIQSEQQEAEVTLVTDDNAKKRQARGDTTKVNDDVWHHVLGVRDGKTIRIYIDGILEGSNTNLPDNYDLSGASQRNVLIGAIYHQGGGYTYKTYGGLIDEVQVYDCALTAENARYMAGLGPLTKPGYYGPCIIHYTFDEGSGTTAGDSSGNALDGTISADVNGVLEGVAWDGTCLDFQSAGTVINTDAGPYLNGLSEFSVSLWIKSDVIDTDKGFIIFADPAGNDQRGMRYDTVGASSGGDDVIKHGVATGSGSEEDESSQYAQTTDWQHLVMSWESGAGKKLYINGLPDTPAYKDAAESGKTSGYQKIIVGKGGKDGAADAGWDGKIDDVRVYGCALTEGNARYLAGLGDKYIPPVYGPLVLHYECDGDVNDSSGNNRHGTINGAVGFETDAERGEVLDLPGGDNQYVAAPQVGISGNDETTIACWAKADHTSIPDWTLVFGFSTPGGGCGSHFNIGSIGGPGGVGAHAWCWERTIFTDQEALDWHHYAMTYDGANITYYGDAEPVATEAMDLSIRGDYVNIGKRNTQASSFPGNVDDARVYNIELSYAQIRHVSGLPTNDVADTWKPNKHADVTLEIDDPHWGEKAMRLDYGKDGYAKREYKKPNRADYAGGDAKALSLWFKGNAENAALPLCIELESGDKHKAKVYHDDPDAATIGEWTEWNIALTDFQPCYKPVDLTDIKKIKVKLQGGSGLPEDGGSMLFDDIRLYPSRCVPEMGGPAADFTGDCLVYYDDVEVMFNEWLLSEEENGLWAGAWTSQDIGDVDPNGSFTDNGDGTYTMTADGADIWGNADAFHFAHQQMSGDGQIIVRVSSLVNTNTWAKAGVMMRQDLDPNSAHTIMAITPGQGVTMQGRDVKGGGSFHMTLGGRTAPMCLRLVRVGDTFTGYFYEDGVWKEQGTRVIPMTDPIYVGMAATSHAYGMATTAEFDRACIASMVDLNEDGIINFLDYAELMEQWLVEILWP